MKFLAYIFFVLGLSVSGFAHEAEVMTFNIRNDNGNDRGTRDWGHRLPMVAAEMKKASIIGVQEALAGQMQDLLDKLPDYSYVGVGRADGKEGGEFSPIFYDKTVWKVLQAETFWLSDTPEKIGSRTWGNDYTRICTWAQMENKEGAKIYVFNTHFDHRSQNSREKAAELILKMIKSRNEMGDPVILLGDFNAVMTNKAIRTLVEAVDDKKKPVLIDSYLATKPENKNPATFNRWKADYKGMGKIDFIFHSPDMKSVKSAVLNPVVDGAVASDHMPQISTIRW